MKALRTQIYLTREQRERLDEISRMKKKSLAQLIRDAIDAFLERDEIDAEEAMRETFGADPNFSVPPREVWSERDRRLWGDKPPR